MSSRILITLLACLALSWANGVNSVEAQFVRKPVTTTIEPLPVTYADPVEQVLMPKAMPEMLIAPPDPSRFEPPYVDKNQSSKSRAIEYRLRQPISLNIKDVPLRQAAADLTLICGVPVVLDMAAMDDAKINLDAPISISVDNIDLKSALNLMLNRLHLRFAIENDAIMITVPEKRVRLRRVTYPVSGLVVPVATLEGQKTGKTNEAALIELITNTVAKNTWKSMGGYGTIEYFPAGKALVVNQPQEIQEEVQLLLATLRKLHELTVSADVRLVQASPEAAQLWRKEMARHGKPVDTCREVLAPMRHVPATEFILEKADSRKGPSSFVAVESELQLKQLLQTDSTVSISQAPKISIDNGDRYPLYCLQRKALVATFLGQTVNPDIYQLQLIAGDWVSVQATKNDPAIVVSQIENIVSGWRCDLTPVVAPDRKSVRLTVRLEHFAKDEAKSVERVTRAAKTFVVPDASTLVWDLGETAGQHLFVLITPRVQVREEEERIFLGEIPPIPGR